MLMPSIYSYDDILSHCDLSSLTGYMDKHIKNRDVKNVSIPEKSMIFVDNPRSIFISMPALDQKLGYYINKIGTFFERSSGQTLPTIHAMLMVFSSKTGEPLAILDGQAVTNLKCAAITSIVTHACADSRADTLAIIGAGVQAEQQIHGVCAVRKIKEVLVFNRGKNR
jgi:ornithine cyclodeaminase/alanine dehydrogenase-like protein (mu-crystallin family)